MLHKGKQVYVQGEPLYTTEYSDSLLMFLLKVGRIKSLAVVQIFNV